ncbi:hypothetical protein KC322_g71 [Hortaea werneckii]|nr:hypothetical protein KC322_g71 [Hortaea werneckii]
MTCRGFTCVLTSALDPQDNILQKHTKRKHQSSRTTRGCSSIPPSPPAPPTSSPPHPAWRPSSRRTRSPSKRSIPPRTRRPADYGSEEQDSGNSRAS